ncbi:helix-turn-helix domain-containing protein [Paenibacillaceae bacterium WGS1546]|uniref:helix-turn-helix domain-containing protein n=1 Tax=Cohnella sp. WGS1546 TaxID=3366810 RepID=UPI00372D3D27
MIKIKVSDMLGKYKMTQKELSEKTGIRPATLSAYYRETIKEIGKEHLNALCRVFNCQPGDILEYIPDEPVSQQED